MGDPDAKMALVTLLCLSLANEQTPERFQVAVQKGYLKITGMKDSEPLYLPTQEGKEAVADFLAAAGLTVRR